MTQCTTCGKEAKDGDTFCRYCGARLNAPLPGNHEPMSSKDVSEEDLARFVGRNADKYLDRFRKFRKSGTDSFAASWNWSAFFFSFWWLLYRKLYLWALVAVAIGLVPYVRLIVMIVFGILGNYLYYKQAKTKLLKLNALPGTDEDRVAAIARAGGVSTVPVVVAAVVVVAIIAAIAIPQFEMYRQRAFDLEAKKEIQEACNHAVTIFRTQPEKTMIEPDDLLNAGLARSPEVEMMLLDGRRETFSLSAKHTKGGKIYFVDRACYLREELQEK